MTESSDQFEPGLAGFPIDAGRSDDRGRSQLDMLLSDFTDRQRRGERVTASDFALKYPEFAEKILELFPLVSAMERLKERKEASILKQRLAHDVQLEKIGGCRIVRELGRGGMGVVFEAELETNGNRVAVKLLPWRHLDASRFREQFEREAQLTASLRHRNITPVLDYGESDGFSYYVMQFIEGVGLDWIIQRLRGTEGIVYAEEIERLHASRNTDSSIAESEANDDPEVQPAPGQVADAAAAKGTSAHHRSLRRDAWPQIARIGLQVADALHYAHTAGTVHRDIKPANLLLDKDGKVWVTDFGLAQAVEQMSDDGGDVAGTLRYMAPERFSGHFDQRSDIYALGVTLYELITLKPAFAEQNEQELARQIIESGPVPPLRHNAEISLDLVTIVRKAIARDPARRFQTAGELSAELRRFLNGQPLRTKRPGLLERMAELYRRAVGRK